MINGLHHLALNTHDIDRLTDFYVGQLGFERVFSGGWADSEQHDRMVGLEKSECRSAVLRTGNVYLEIFEYHQPPPEDLGRPHRANDRGYVHMCFDVSDLDSVYEKLSKAGMVFHCPPQTFLGGKVKTTYGRDPDGNIIEMQEVRARGMGFTLDDLKAPLPPRENRAKPA